MLATPWQAKTQTRSVNLLFQVTFVIGLNAIYSGLPNKLTSIYDHNIVQKVFKMPVTKQNFQHSRVNQCASSAQFSAK